MRVEVLLALLCFCISLAVLLVIVAVVGHGIWLMAAAIFGGSKRHDDDVRRPAGRRLYRKCVGCGEEFFRDADHCPECGLDPQGKVAVELKDLEATARTIQRLRDEDLVSADAAEQIYKGIEDRQQRSEERRVGKECRL